MTIHAGHFKIYKVDVDRPLAGRRKRFRATVDTDHIEATQGQAAADGAEKIFFVIYDEKIDGTILTN